MLMYRHIPVFVWPAASSLAASLGADPSRSGRNAAKCSQYPGGAVYPHCAVSFSVHRRTESGTAGRSVFIPVLIVCLSHSMFAIAQSMNLSSAFFVLRKTKQSTHHEVFNRQCVDSTASRPTISEEANISIQQLTQSRRRPNRHRRV